MARRRNGNESVRNVPGRSTMGGSRPRGRGVRKKLPRDAQGLAVNQLCRRGLKIVLWGGAKAQHNPWEAVSPVAARQAGPERGLHVPMKPLAKSVALWVIGCGTVDLHPQDPGDRSPKLRRELRPRSEERSDGVPKRATQAITNARATSAAVVEYRGTTCGHLVVLSTMVRR